VLENLKPTAETHAGLLLQRYLTAHKPKQRDNTQDTPEEMLLDQATGVKASEVYHAAFDRWLERFVQKTPAGCARVHFTVQAAAPIAIGLGDASPLEVGMRLHHTYGMPLLPASALKGLCRRVARLLRHDSKLSDEAIDALFGFSREKQAAAGAVVFYDAWYVPSSAGGAPFHRDVITVHHPAYYGDGKTPPTDFDDPTPVPFLVIKPGAQFLCVLDAPDRRGRTSRKRCSCGGWRISASARRPTRATATSRPLRRASHQPLPTLRSKPTRRSGGRHTSPTTRASRPLSCRTWLPKRARKRKAHRRKRCWTRSPTPCASSSERKSGSLRMW
jgi:CRISPR type III-B/RAMP module RAMP protein Cmr6